MSQVYLHIEYDVPLCVHVIIYSVKVFHLSYGKT